MFKQLIIVCCVISSLLSIYITIVSIIQKKNDKPIYFTLFSTGVTLGTIAYISLLTADHLQEALYPLKMQYICSPFLNACLFLFIRSFCNKEIKSKWLISLIFLLPVIIVIDIFLSLGLFFQGATIISNPPISIFGMKPGKYFIFYILHSLIFSILSIYTLIRNLKKGSKLFYKQSITIIIAVLVPMAIGSIPDQIGTIASIFALPITLILLMYAIKLGIFDVLPLALENIGESMRDALIILGEQNKFIQCNTVAKEMFNSLKNMQLGSVLEHLQGISITDILGDGHEGKFSMIIHNDKKHFRSSITNFHQEGKLIGRSILIFDVTETVLLMESLEKIAHTDVLTGIFNRRYFFELVEQKSSGLQNNKIPSCVIMMDIDFFKSINDKGGHLYGDFVLKKFADTCTGVLRKDDIFGRYGGEEFCILLPDTKMNDAVSIAERIRKTIENTDFTLDHIHMSVTVSVGIAACSYVSSNFIEEALSKADSALYEAKSTGRNKVCVSGD